MKYPSGHRWHSWFSTPSSSETYISTGHQPANGREESWYPSGSPCDTQSDTLECGRFPRGPAPTSHRACPGR
eukprot:1811991-Rhodomonas_salina.2